LLCGVGFTMSLFINNLAFRSAVLQDETKLGVLAGSLLSALAGWAVLALAAKRQRAEETATP
jgi:NhaA family Na+:H+ antiporter